MKFEPLVSIVIPVYNGSNYMKEAIDSALAQTYKNIEIIVVNDGSIDNTDEIAKSYGDKIRYLKKENGGVSTALNLGIKNMKGEYFSWLSHDDVYYPNKIERQIDELNKLDDKNTILYSDYAVINEKSEVIHKTDFSNNFLIHKLDYPLFSIFKGLIHGCALLIPKKCFNEIGLFDINLKTTQDYKLWFQMFPNYKIKFIPECLIKSRNHNEQTSKSNSLAKWEADELWIYMVKNLSEDNMLLFDGSVLKFYENTASALKRSNYLKVYEYLCNKAETYKKNIKDITEIKISVICPFYNRIECVEEAIISVINQTYANWELLLVDDISTDDISNIENYTKDSRIKLLKNKYKKGTSGARNTGIEYSKGDYIAFLDSDDLFLPKKLEKQVKFMLKTDSMISHTSYETFLELDYIETLDVGKDIIFPNIIDSCPIATPTVMINTRILKNNEFRFIEEYLYGEDHCLWISIAKTYTINGINKVLTKVRKDANSTTNNKVRSLKGLSNIFSFILTEENINYYPRYLCDYSKRFDGILFDQIRFLHEKNKDKIIINISILKIENKNRFIIFTFLHFIKLSIKVNDIAWWIPVRKWRDNFRNKFK